LFYRKKQCPSCRLPIGHQRLFRPDEKLSQIIGALIEDIDAYNKFEEENRGLEVQKTYDFR
jgi:hypothetical protein